MERGSKGEPKRSTWASTDQAAGLFTLHPPPDLDPTVSDTVKVKPLLPQTLGGGMQPAQNPSKAKVGYFCRASSCSTSWGTLPRPASSLCRPGLGFLKSQGVSVP